MRRIEPVVRSESLPYLTRGRLRRSEPLPPSPGLQSLKLIENIGDSEPYRIIPVVQCQGGAASEEDVMAARVKWANKALFHVLTRDVPPEFAPYNAIIRIRYTEDRRTDYLALIYD